MEPRIRLLLFTERHLLSGNFRSLQTAFDRVFDVQRVLMDDRWVGGMQEIPDYGSFDAALWFVRFSELVRRPSFDWAGYSGRRVMYDQDVIQDAHAVRAGGKYRGAWRPAIQRHGFDALVCTGSSDAQRMRDLGVEAHWIPKAYDPTVFQDLGRQRSGVAHFGAPYPSRLAMLRFVQKHGVQVRNVSVPYQDLNQALNSFLVCLVCNMDSKSLIPPRLARWVSWMGLRVWPGPEVMLKNFEASAAGCAVFCDASPDLERLGFRDGEHVVTYRDFRELTEKLDRYLAHPWELERIRLNGAALCRTHHTWDHRMGLLKGVLGGGESSVTR